jgi:Mn2+/Fe2+ NRAMP family transporter
MQTEEKHGIREAPKGLGGLLRNIGPGVVLSGSVVGPGELLVTTRMGAEVGIVFLWGVIVACLVKFFIQLELGRQCILHNNTSIQVLNRVAGPQLRNASWVSWVCMVGYFLVMIALIGILVSVAGLMVTLFPGIPYSVWAVAIFLAMSVLLYRGLYNDLEKMVSFLVASFSLIVIGSVLLLQGTPYAFSGKDLLSGFRFTMPPEGAFVALAVMGSVGATAVELFMYPYWIREKGYPDFVGPQQDTPEWRQRYRGWMRVLFTDTLVCTLIATVITCAYYLLGASILKQLSVLPQGMKVVEQVSLIFTETIGGWAYYLFMFGGFCTLFSTLLVFTASAGRISVDFLHQVGMSSLNREEARRRLVRILQIAFPFFWLCVTLAKSDTPLAFVLVGANANNLLLIPMAYGIVHLAMRAADRERMPLWIEIGLLLTVWVIINFTAINLYLRWTH